MSSQNYNDNPLSPREAEKLLMKKYRQEGYSHGRSSTIENGRIVAGIGVVCFVIGLLSFVNGLMHDNGSVFGLELAGICLIAGVLMEFFAYLAVLPSANGGKQFMEDFFKDEVTAECRNRKRAAIWLWAFTSQKYWAWTHGNTALWNHAKYKSDYSLDYSREDYLELSHLLKWL